MNSRFRAVIGVDQTGAKSRLGSAKPLPTSLILHDGLSFRLCSPLFLPAFNKKNIENLIELQGFKCDWSEVLVVGTNRFKGMFRQALTAFGVILAVIKST